MRRWQLLLIPGLLVANYFFMVIRHEAAHGMVALLFGDSILDFHIWPPANGNLSWITTLSFAQRTPASMQLQASLPHLVSLVLLLSSLFWLASSRPAPFVRLNIELTGVAFPLLDLGSSVVAYWIGDNDFYFVFGRGTPLIRVVLSTWVLALALFALWIVVSRRKEN